VDREVDDPATAAAVARARGWIRWMKASLAAIGLIGSIQTVTALATGAQLDPRLVAFYLGAAVFGLFVSISAAALVVQPVMAAYQRIGHKEPDDRRVRAGTLFLLGVGGAAAVGPLSVSGHWWDYENADRLSQVIVIFIGLVTITASAYTWMYNRRRLVELVRKRQFRSGL
jgi:hypothetical protein